MTDPMTGNAGPAAARPRRWRHRASLCGGRRMSAKRKQSAVLRLRRGEDLELVSRALALWFQLKAAAGART